MEETAHALWRAQRSPRGGRRTRTCQHCATNVGLRQPSLTLKLRLDFPGAGGEASEHVAVAVLEQHQAGPPVCDAPAELRKAVPVELGREEQAPAEPPLLGQVRVDVDDGQDVQDAGELPLRVHLALGDQGGQLEGRAQEEEALVDDQAQKRGHVVSPEHPVLEHGLVTVAVQPLRPQKLPAT